MGYTYQGDYAEAYRPQYHYSPASGWMNDPNGLVYYQGEYHLFYQYHPDLPLRAMHWGHAVSTDLVHWQHLPPALYPEPDLAGEGLMGNWSGSAAIDWQDTGGFRSGAAPAMVAALTQVDTHGTQQQSIAYSNDRGRTWIMYAGNPVVPNPGIRDFRDPHLFWHEASGRWVMVVAAGEQVMLYTSSNLREWTFASAFGAGEGSHRGVWECPNLFEMPVAGEPETSKWILMTSVMRHGSLDDPGTQYLIGDFDGTTFTVGGPGGGYAWLDYGRDNYAGITFTDVPADDGRRIHIGWMGNWATAFEVPTSPWRGAMTVPRELILAAVPGGSYRLRSRPVRELRALRGRYRRIEDRPLSGAQGVTMDGIAGGAFEVRLAADLGTVAAVNVRVGNGQGETTVIGYDGVTGGHVR